MTGCTWDMRGLLFFGFTTCEYARWLRGIVATFVRLRILDPRSLRYIVSYDLNNTFMVSFSMLNLAVCLKNDDIL